MHRVTGRPRNRRIAAVALYRVRVGIAEAKEPDLDTPLAVVVARPGGAVQDEASLLGNTPLDEVSRAAWELGVRPGSTIAAARARVADLRVRVVHARAVEATLARLAEASLAFGATVSFSSEEDMVWIDVTGCGHLFASERDPSGEETIAARVGELLRSLHLTGRVAIAEGPRLAAACARHAPYPPGHALAPWIVKSGEAGSAMSRLPVRALPLDDDTRAWLEKLGIRKVADVCALPSDALGMRLGDGCGDVLALARGEDASPLVPYVPPEAPEERVDLEYGVEATEALVFVARTLADRMALRLAGRALATTRLSLVFDLDRALLRDEESGGKKGESKTSSSMRALNLTLAAPMQQGAEIFAVLRARLESGEKLPAPVRAVTLRAADLVAKGAASLDLFVPEARAERALPRLYEELSADLGVERVGMLALVSSHRPEDRARLVPIASRAVHTTKTKKKSAPLRSSAAKSSTISAGVEPTRLLPVPAPFLAPREGVEQCCFLARHEAVEWWQSGGSFVRGTNERDTPSGVDFLAVWLEDEQAMAWVEVDRRTGVAMIRGWLD